MNKTSNTEAAAPVESTSPESTTDAEIGSNIPNTPEQRMGLGWWVKVIVQPLIFVVAFASLLAGIGLAQRWGWLGSAAHDHAAAAEGSEVRYICPMMCTPPQSEPGRCPVCGMELVPATNSSQGDSLSVEIAPAARRIAKIETAPVVAVPMTRTIKAIGELNYDEGSLKTLSAYVDGRIDRLYADYTGVVVKENDPLALVYSPRLYSSQVEFLLAAKAKDRSQTSTLKRVTLSNAQLYESSRQRLSEFGMTAEQIKKLEAKGVASSRLELLAPISGTVIEKLAVEGQYIKEGQAIYKLADLSTVWLMLELFPEDAASVRYGQRVEARVQSLPGRVFSGRVAFVDPNVDPKTRTVGVRVVFQNEEGHLRIGDFAKASIETTFAIADSEAAPIYDPELAGKWVSPRHPHIIKSAPGKCPECGIELVEASTFGFTDDPGLSGTVLTIPRNALLVAGPHSIVYAESEPGRFEIRRVTTGPTRGSDVVVLEGLDEGERVATRGNFLIDSQMQLAGNPSLIDPTRAKMKRDDGITPEMEEAFSKLTSADQKLAREQLICPVADFKLGSMGTPIKVIVKDRPVFLCCEGCRDALLEEPEKFFAKLDQQRAKTEAQVAALDPAEQAKIDKAMSQLTAEDREIANAQRICPVAKMPLGSMGTPIKVKVENRPVFICCKGCADALQTHPAKYLKVLDGSKEKDELPGALIAPEGSEDQPDLDDLPLIEPPAESESTQPRGRIAEALNKLEPQDRKLAQSQDICPVANEPLGSMGTPIKVKVGDKDVFICCEGCRSTLLEHPQKYLARLSQGRKR